MSTEPRRPCRFDLAAPGQAPFLRHLAPLASVALLMTLVAGSPSVSAAAKAPAPSVAHLRCEYKVDPIGIDSLKPRLSWRLESEARGVIQTAYRIQVSRDVAKWGSKSVVWDTDKVASDRSIHVPYEGPALESGRRYYWRVQVWDGSDRSSKWSAPGFWEMGLLLPEDWKAAWITPSGEEDTSKSQPAPLLRGTFEVDGKVSSVRAYVTSLGLYELEINGERVGDQVFTPGWTSYHHRLQYQTYDVTDHLRPGDNVVGATLGDGWYRGFLGWGDRRNVYGDRLALLCQLRHHVRGRPRGRSWAPTTLGGPPPVRSSTRTSTWARPTTRGSSDPDGARPGTTTATGQASVPSIRARRSWWPPPGPRCAASRRCARSRS